VKKGVLKGNLAKGSWDIHQRGCWNAGAAGWNAPLAYGATFQAGYGKYGATMTTIDRVRAEQAKRYNPEAYK
jgi:hypothetical protein